VDLDISGQVDAFKLIIIDLDTKFNDTIIRIPFKTNDQAKSNEINKLMIIKIISMNHIISSSQ